MKTNAHRGNQPSTKRKSREAKKQYEYVPHWKVKSFIYVALSIIFILIIFLTGPVIADQFINQIIELSGLAIGIMAAWEMSTSNSITIFPEPGKKAKLVTTGPYAYIRNPMYLSVILITGSLVADSFSLLRFLIFILLVITLIEKIAYEETLLRRKFPEYLRYKQHTHRLIPYIY